MVKDRWADAIFFDSKTKDEKDYRKSVMVTCVFFSPAAIFSIVLLWKTESQVAKYVDSM